MTDRDIGVNDLAVVCALIALPWDGLIRNKADADVYSKSYGEMLDSLDPKHLSLSLSLGLLRYVYMGRTDIGTPWYSFRDRLCAHCIESGYSEEYASDLMMGLMGSLESDKTEDR